MNTTDQAQTGPGPAVAGPVHRQVRPLCSQCRFPLDEYTSGLRHFGTHTAHVEWYCVQRMGGEIDRLRAALHRLLHEDMMNDLTDACEQARKALGDWEPNAAGHRLP